MERGKEGETGRKCIEKQTKRIPNFNREWNDTTGAQALILITIFSYWKYNIKRMARHGKAQHTAQPSKWEKKQSDKQKKKKNAKTWRKNQNNNLYIYCTNKCIPLPIAAFAYVCSFQIQNFIFFLFVFNCSLSLTLRLEFLFYVQLQMMNFPKKKSPTEKDFYHSIMIKDTIVILVYLKFQVVEMKLLRQTFIIKKNSKIILIESKMVVYWVLSSLALLLCFQFKLNFL